MSKYVPVYCPEVEDYEYVMYSPEFGVEVCLNCGSIHEPLWR